MSQAIEWDFFISYTQADRAWAEWIAWELEQNEHRVLVQAWDAVPGSNWTSSMHEGTTGARRTIAVLSAEYLTSVCGGAEWQAAWAADPDGRRGQLLPVRVADCDRPGLLAGVVSVDLFGLSEAQARTALLALVTPGRAKPHHPPRFPGVPLKRAIPGPAPFPGALSEAVAPPPAPVRRTPVIRTLSVVAAATVAVAVVAPLVPFGCRERQQYEVREYADVLDERGNKLIDAEIGELFVLLDQPVDVPKRRYGAIVGKEETPGYVLMHKLRPTGTVCV